MCQPCKPGTGYDESMWMIPLMFMGGITASNLTVQRRIEYCWMYVDAIPCAITVAVLCKPTLLLLALIKSLHLFNATYINKQNVLSSSTY